MAYLGIPPFGSRTSRTVTEVVATSGQTTFYPTGGYIPGYLDVIVNGVELNSSEYVATDSSTVVLSTACQAGDEVKLVSFALSLAGNGAYTRTSFVATSNQTTFAATYTPGAVAVYLNGVLLRDQNYVATDGVSIVLDAGVPSGTLLDVVAYSVVTLGQINWNLVLNKPTTLSGYGITDGFTLPSQAGNAGEFLTTDGTTASWAVIDSSPRITSITYPADDLAANPSGGQTITVNGANFVNPTTVYFGDTVSPSVTFVSTTQLQVTTPAKAAGTYPLYVVSSNGTTATYAPGINFSGVPAWTTDSNLGTIDDPPGTVSIQLQATSNSTVTYSLATGSTLPGTMSLNSTGLLSGTLSAGTTINFSVKAQDQENQDTTRSFQLQGIVANPYRTDSNAANLFIALPFTTYLSGVTGGGYADVSAQIRTYQGLTAGTAKTPTQTGSTVINNDVTSPFAQYTNSLVFPSNQTQDSDLYYYTHNLSFASAKTVEFRIYIPTSITGSTTLLATNNLGGGYYPALNLYKHNDANGGNLRAFSNSGPTSGTVGGGTSLPKGSWNHVAYVFDGSGSSLQIYLNGTRVFSGGYGANSGQSIFTIGATNWDGINSDEVGLRFQDFRIYNIAKYSGTSFALSSTNADLGGSILK